MVTNFPMKTRRKKKTKTNSPVLHIREDHSERGGFFMSTHFTHQFTEKVIHIKLEILVWGGLPFPVLFVVILGGQFWKEK